MAAVLDDCFQAKESMKRCTWQRSTRPCFTMQSYKRMVRITIKPFKSHQILSFVRTTTPKAVQKKQSKVTEAPKPTKSMANTTPVAQKSSQGKTTIPSSLATAKHMWKILFNLGRSDRSWKETECQIGFQWMLRTARHKNPYSGLL